jgi:hypothetical protein
MYDVWHFTVTANVAADKVDDFLRVLGKNRMITPLTVELRSMDAAEALGRNYVYGERPVIGVTAQCEALFLRSWTEKLMPPLIKQQLGITPPGGATPTASAGGM